MIHLVQRVLQRLDGSLNVRFDNEVELFNVSVGHRIKEVFKRNVLDAILLLNTGLQGTLIGKLASITLFREDTELIAGAGYRLQTKNLNGIRRSGLGYGIALRIKHGTDATKRHTGHKSIANMQRTAGYQNRCNRAATAIELCLQNITGSKGIGVGFQLKYVRLQQNGFKKLVNTLALLGGDINEHVLSAPLFRNDAMLGKFLPNTGWIGAGLIDFVNGNDNGNACGLCVVDGFNGLRHHAVVRRDNQNNDVGHLCTTGTHGGKRFVTGRVNKGNTAAVDGNLRSTDGLRNTACLTGGNTRMPNGVQKRSFTVVNVAHNGNDRRTGLKIFWIVIEGKGIFFFLCHNLDFPTQIFRNKVNQIIGHGLGKRQWASKQKEALDNVVGRNAEKIRKLGDG